MAVGGTVVFPIATIISVAVGSANTVGVSDDVWSTITGVGVSGVLPQKPVSGKRAISQIANTPNAAASSHPDCG